ncbi:dipeptide epimerase [Cytophagaceae bacterium DM2B3-1]|uniref:Dipeptide epimerase n=1 Tax=Xanthocytophaga flava TaxID=3048013 RepID=A0ABT7CJ92_9BACT|nr:dipeptide epimerase [Xanthocytophaga flavus]MDJ1492744.1 dipeptide epimerase [Xanthocytophaga flavus]
MNLILRSFDLPLKHTFTISYDSRDVQPTLIVELTDGIHHGYGEATSNPYYGVTIESMTAILESLRNQIQDTPILSPEAFWLEMHSVLKDHSFAQCALDIAAHDWYGKSIGEPLYKHWGLSTQNLPLTNYTIGIDSVEKMVAKLKELPWPIYKIKLGTADDVAIVRELRKHTEAIFRVDANCAWTPEETIRNSYELQKLGVEFIEQPLKADNWVGMKEVYTHSALPLIADESCITENDVTKCHGHFHGINIKLVKCGGLTPARRMIAEARTLGMKVMVGCMTESTIGISAIGQLLPLLDYVDMDGALLLSKDIATGVSIDYGKVTFSNQNGTGAELIENA